MEPVLLTTYVRGDGARTLGVTRRWTLPGVLSAVRALHRLDFDVVHVQFAPSLFGFRRAVGLLPLLLSRRMAMVVTLHEYGVWRKGRGDSRWRSRLWSAVERQGWADRETLFLVPRADALLVCSSEQLDVLAERFGHRAPVAREVPIGLNVLITPGKEAAETRAAVRRQLGAASDAPLVAFFGFLHPEKSLDRLIAAVAALRDSWPDVHLLLIGGAESHSVNRSAARALLAELDRVSASHGMTDRVHITGYVPDATVSEFLGAADVAAFPLNDGVTSKSGSLLAAFMAGVPVVATAPVGQVREPTEVNGVLRVPPRDTAALTEALRTVLSDSTLAERLRTTGRTVADRHGWSHIAAVHAQIYDQVLTGSGDRGWDNRRQPWQSGPRPARKGRFMSLVEQARSALTRSVNAVRDRLLTHAEPAGHRATEDPALFKTLVYGDPARLHIAPTAIVNNALFNLSSGDITVGDYAFFGHNVSVLTGSHDWTKFGAERQVAVPTSGRDVIIEEGAWVSSNAIIVAPCRIGAHAVVGVGSLVMKDVDPYTIVAGSPAKVLRTIPRPDKADSVDQGAGAGKAAAG